MVDSTDGYTKIETIQLPGVGGHGDFVGFDPDTQTIWLSQSPDNNEVVINTSTNSVEAVIPNIGDANGVSFSPQYAFVADVGNNTTDVINKYDFQVVARIAQTGTTPDGVSYISSTNQVAVASDDANVLDFINALPPFTQTSSTQLLPNPAVDGPDVQTYVPQKDLIYQPDDRQIDVIDPHTGQIVNTFANLVPTGTVKPMVYDPITNDLVVGTTDDELLVLNANTGTVENTIAIPGSVDEGTIDVGARLAFFGDKSGTVDIVNLNTDQLVGNLPAEVGVHTLAVDPGNGDLYVYENNGNTVDVWAPTEAVVCFVAGTLIRAVRDGRACDVAVEELVVGDLVATASGATRPVRWLGHRTVDPRRDPRPRDAHPVRIAAGAFGVDRPARDLWLSPGHALCLDMLGEVLVPAGALVNGSTVQQVETDCVTYWHVELDSHDVILAENMPAESYRDVGNRAFFAEGKVVSLAATPDAGPALRAPAGLCRPFHNGGALVEAVRAQLDRRAADLRPESVRYAARIA